MLRVRRTNNAPIILFQELHLLTSLTGLRVSWTVDNLLKIEALVTERNSRERTARIDTYRFQVFSRTETFSFAQINSTDSSFGLDHFVGKLAKRFNLRRQMVTKEIQCILNTSRSCARLSRSRERTDLVFIRFDVERRQLIDGIQRRSVHRLVRLLVEFDGTLKFRFRLTCERTRSHFSLGTCHERTSELRSMRTR